VDLLSDILQNSTLSDSNIEKERRTILKEMEVVQSTTNEVIFDYLHSAAYQGTSLGRTILGPRRNVESIKRSDLVDYIAKHYTAPRMVLVGSGAVKHEELLDLAKNAFAALPTDENSYSEHPVFTGSEIRVRNDDLPLAHIAVAVEGLSWTDPDYFTLLVIQTILGNWDRNVGGGNNLASNLCELIATEYLAHSLTTFHVPYHNTGLFGNYFVTTPDKVEDLTAEVLSEWQRIANGATPAEVERAKHKLQASLLLTLDGSSVVAEDIGRQLITIGRRLPAAEIFMRVNDITVNDVRRVALDRCTDISPAVSAIGPIEHLPDYNQIRGWTYWNRI